MVAKQPAVKRIAATDVVISAGLPFLFALAWVTPAATWPALSSALAVLIPHIFRQNRRSLLQHIRKRVDNRELPVSPDEIVRHYYAAHVERKLLILRMYRPGRWSPSVTLSGQDELDAALERGKGVVLWDSHFAFSTLISKMALAQAGYEIHHLSHPSHGFDTATAYGMRVLNPLVWSIEDRFLRERVKLSLDSPTGAIRTLMRRLRANGVVTVTVRDNDSNAHRYAFLDGSLGIGNGAPFLAAKTGAALLPVFTLRGDDGSHEVIVGPRISLDADVAAEARIERAVLEYVARLESYVLRYPEQWLGWSDR